MALDDARAAIESQVSSLWAGRTSVQWGDRPFTVPAAGEWLRVTLLFGDGFLSTMDGRNEVPGVLDLTVFAPKHAGPGNVTRLADYARQTVHQVDVDSVRFGTPAGPVSLEDDRFAVVSVSVPFIVEET